MRNYGSASRGRRASISSNASSLPPFPAKQLLVLACCRICEPIAFMSIFPYIYYMIEDFHVTNDSSKISVYAAMVTSAFTLAESASGVLWGRVSDRIGRKPVLLFGLAGTAFSVLVFGFVPSLPVALFARALGGLLNGNIGVLQTTVAELVTVKEHQPRAYTVMPMVWCIGSIIGPMVGGALARPCISYPGLFARGTIWDRYPYLLPNLFSACTVFVGIMIGIPLLEETHAAKKGHRDHVREMGDPIASKCPSISGLSCRDRAPGKKVLLRQECLSSEESSVDECLTQYQSAACSTKLGPQADPEPEPIEAVPYQASSASPSRIFTKPVIMNIVSYGILAFHNMTFDQLLPVFLSTAPPKHPNVELPFKFFDGFGLETNTIGIVMSVQGVYSLISNYVLVAPVTRRLGSLRLFRILALSYFALYLVTPYAVLLPKTMIMPAIYILVVWKCTFSTMAYPSNAILLANSAPFKEVLGTINGIAASTASLCRALGPMVSGILYSLGLQTGYSGLAWWFSGLVAIVGAYLSLEITEGGPQDHFSARPSAYSELENERILNSYDDNESV